VVAEVRVHSLKKEKKRKKKKKKFKARIKNKIIASAQVLPLVTVVS
jgi:hypothetical protein